MKVMKRWVIALLKLQLAFLGLSVVTGIIVGLYLSFTDNPVRDQVNAEMCDRGWKGECKKVNLKHRTD